ncbi:MAG: type II secretion system F family protein [Verrucomicrobiae bacterium]|nr:type II secretion system F family protein [Verrucomicrobiae bacterium]
MVPILIPLLVLVVFVVIGYAVYRSSTGYQVAQRIERLQEIEVTTQSEELQRPFVERVILPLGEGVARLARRLVPVEPADQNHKKLVMAGLFPRVSANQFQGLCWLSAALGFLLMFLLIMSVNKTPARDVNLSDPLNLAYLLLGLFAGYKIPHFILGRRIRMRQEEILASLPYAIDLLSISVEAGMGFDSAVGYTMRRIKGPLAEEFSKTLNEIRLGKPRLEALEDLGNRTGVEELKIFITAVVHASRLGGSITNTLRVQADSIRTRHRQRVQELAMKAPVKMVFPLVLFIFPALFVVILGPALISIIRNL